MCSSVVCVCVRCVHFLHVLHTLQEGANVFQCPPHICCLQQKCCPHICCLFRATAPSIYHQAELVRLKPQFLSKSPSQKVKKFWSLFVNQTKDTLACRTRDSWSLISQYQGKASKKCPFSSLLLIRQGGGGGGGRNVNESYAFYGLKAVKRA